MAWFKRRKQNITTPTEDKKDVPRGIWYKTPTGKVIETDELANNFYVSPEDDYHVRIGSEEYFKIIFDDKKYKEYDAKVSSKDPLKFKDSKTYTSRLKEAKKKSGLKDSIRNASGKLNGNDLVVSAMDFDFIGGSMGSVVGEKISRAVDRAIELNCPYIIICQSGGARMMEAAISLMQLAKIQAKLSQLADRGLPYFPLLTHPTFGGVTASFAMVGDVILAEPGALIGFAGPRVIKETIGKDLPEGFQTSEFLLEKGFVDIIVHRRNLKSTLATLCKFLQKESTH